MTHEAELAHALDKIWEKGNERNWILGRLGVENGTDAAIDLVGRPGYVIVSLGAAGDLGVSIARDRVGAERTNFQLVRMRRENGELVIREASAYAGGTGGGSDTLAGLSDVTLTSPVSGNTLQYNGSKWINVVPAGGGGGAPSPHDHESSHHTPGSKLNWTSLNYSGSSLSHIVARDHSQLNSITADQHHPQVHPLVGTDHTATGLLPGQTIRAANANTFVWDFLKHTDLDPATVLPDQHHNQRHDIIGPDHTATAPAFSIVGTTATDVLGYLTATHDPGATERLLKTSIDGSLYLDTNLLYVDAPNNRVGINRQPMTPGFGAAALDVIVSNLADHTQRIKQKANQTGRMWRIEDIDGNELIVLDSVGNLQSGNPGFYSGLRGWQITPGGNAEFNNIWARGSLHATVFVKDEVHATGGTFMVATAGNLHAAATIDASTTDTEAFEVESTAAAFPGTGSLPLTIESSSPTFTGTTLEVQGIGNVVDIDDPASGAGFYFTPGEILRVKTEVNEEGNPVKLADIWLEVQYATQHDGYSSYSVIKRSGSDTTIPAGTGIVSYGHRGEGRILMTSDLNYAPYIDVFTTGDNPWDANDPQGIIPRMRMGQLMGVGVPGVSGVSQYGLIAGEDLTNANKGYLIASNLGISLYKANIRLNDGTSDTGLWTASGNLRLGKNVGADATTGFYFDAATGNLYIGNNSPTSENYIVWNQALGTLSIKGALTVGGSGTGYVTLSEMQTADAAVLSSANGTTNTLRSDMTAYNLTHAIHKVTGTWSSAGPSQISWSLIYLVQSDGAARGVVDGSLSGFTERKYLYVEWAATGSFTFVAKGQYETIPNYNYMLVATVDPGPVGGKASINVVAGGVYISGGNIFAESILTGNIKSGQITTGLLAADVITSINSQATNANIYGNRRRVVGVEGTWTFGAINTNAVSGSAITVHFADGSDSTITTFSNYVINGSFPVSYFYVDIGAGVPPATLTMGMVVDPDLIGANGVLIAIGEPCTSTLALPIAGSGYPTFQIVAGKTYISGDRIITGSIVAKNIATNTITADKLNVTELNAINATSTTLDVTGALVIGGVASPGKIYSSGKSSYASHNSVPGFFLGYDGGYKFNIGDANSWLKWNGTDLLLRTKQALLLQASADPATLDQVLQFTDRANNAGSIGFMTYTWAGGTSIPIFTLPVLVKASYFEANNIKFSDPGQTSKDTLIWDFGGVRHAMTYSSPNAELRFTGSFVADGGIVTPNLSTSGDKLIIANSAFNLTGGSAALSAGQIMWGWDAGSSTWNLYLFAPDGPPGSPTYRWRRVVLNRM